MKMNPPLSDFKVNHQQEVILTQAQDWMNDLLLELCEDAPDDEIGHIKESPYIKFSGIFEKKNTPQYNYFILVDGVLEVSFLTTCVKTGLLMQDYINVELRAAFLDETVIENMGLAEETNVFIGTQEYDLYPIQDKKIHLQEAFHEYLYLNKNPYPKMSEIGRP